MSRSVPLGDTSRGPTPAEPTLHELIAASDRVTGEPGLVEQVWAWEDELPVLRKTLDREARALARPRLWPDTIGDLAGTAWRVIGAAAPDAPFVLLSAAAASIGLPVAPPPTDQGTIQRAERLVRAGGPAYIKLGQFIASSRGLLPDSWVDAFAWCRDDAPPLRRGVAEALVKRELGPGVLASFDPEPLAAGSIGQVHRATLADGRAVVVKVRRPGLRRRFRRDIQTLALVSASAGRLWPAARAANLGGFVELFAGLALHELDFRLEALNAVECAAVLEGCGLDAIQVPLPYAGMVTERVLVMPFLDGVRYDLARRRFGSELDGERLVRLAIRGVLQSTLLYGVSHGDLHAGNVLVPAPDRFNLIDFGICGRLDAGERAAIVRFLLAFGTGDADGQVRALTYFSAFERDADLVTLTGRLQDELDRLDGTRITFDRLGATLGRLLRVFAENGFTMPTQLVLFFKNLLYLSSFASSVAPDADLFGLVTAVLGELVHEHPDAFAALSAQDAEAGERVLV